MRVNDTGKDTAEAGAGTAVSSKEKFDSRVEKVLAGFTGKKSELIPILQKVQMEMGYLPKEAMKRISEFTKVPESTLYGVATFYAQFKLIPTGRNIVKVCRGTGCYVKGAPRLLDELTKLLGICDGQTTKDMEYTLETVACFGSCALAPVMVVNDKVYGRVSPDKVKEILHLPAEAATK